MVPAQGNTLAYQRVCGESSIQAKASGHIWQQVPATHTLQATLKGAFAPMSLLQQSVRLLKIVAQAKERHIQFGHFIKKKKKSDLNQSLI